jgi:Rieske Fe-S protein
LTANGNTRKEAAEKECPQVSSTRRDFLTITSVLGLEAVTVSFANPAFADPASDRPKEGDVFVSVEADTETALEPKDIPVGGPPVRAWPMDPAEKVIRKGSRLNRVLLLRFEPGQLIGVTQDRAADGVVAYSAICPHAGCDVTGWDGAQKIIECACHYSHYNPLDGANVIDGPTTRALPALPLKVAQGKLTVAKPFTSRVGIVPG